MTDFTRMANKAPWKFRPRTGSPVPPFAWEWQPFALTAGDGVQWVGFSDGGPTRPQPAFGSISGQPTPRTELLALYDDTASGVFLAVFAGNFVNRLAGVEISFGGFVMDSFEVELIDGNTWVRFTGIPGDLTPGGVYEVEFGFGLQAAPVITIPPSIDPGFGRVGTRFMFDAGEAVGRPDPAATTALLFNGDPVQLDPGGGFTPDAEGALQWSVEWSNGVSPNASAQASAEVAPAFTPAELFSDDQPGYWPGAYNPADGRLWVSETTPALLPGERIYRADRLRGSANALQSTALNRPTLARWPKGGRRNILETTNMGSSALWSFNMLNPQIRAMDYFEIENTSVGAGLYSVPIIIPSGARVTFSAIIEPVLGERPFARFEILSSPAGTFFSNKGLTLNLITGETSAVVGMGDDGADYSVTRIGNKFEARISANAAQLGGARAVMYGGGGSSTVARVRYSNPQLEIGAIRTRYQSVVTANDITESGVPDIWHMSRAAGQALPIALEPGLYGFAWVNEVGAITFGTVTDPAATLFTDRQSDVVLRLGAFTAEEQDLLTAYWSEIYAP